jgi:hypothetical protein
MKSEAVDKFRIDLRLNHPTCDPTQITAELKIQPFASLKVGEKIGPIVRRSTMWMAHFREGVGDEQFAQALEDVIAFLDKHGSYIDEFNRQNGKFVIRLSNAVVVQDGVFFDLLLEPYFLQMLGDYQVALQVIAWSEEAPESTS